MYKDIFTLYSYRYYKLWYIFNMWGQVSNCMINWLNIKSILNFALWRLEHVWSTIMPIMPADNRSLLMYNEFYTKAKIMIWVIFNFTNQKHKFKSPLQILRNVLRKFIVVTNKMSRKQLESTTTRTDVRDWTYSIAFSEYWWRLRTHTLAMEPHAR